MRVYLSWESYVHSVWYYSSLLFSLCFVAKLWCFVSLHHSFDAKCVKYFFKYNLKNINGGAYVMVNIHCMYLIKICSPILNFFFRPHCTLVYSNTQCFLAFLSTLLVWCIWWRCFPLFLHFWEPVTFFKCCGNILLQEPLNILWKLG